MEHTLPARYKLVRLLGEGGMGRVYLVRDAVLTQEVALKVLRPARNPAEREAQRFVFQAEVRSAAALVHPRFVPLFDAGELLDGAPYYTMPFVPGGSLAPLVKAPPPWPLLLPILDQVLEGLAFAHARGVVHRDIKPHNVLLSRLPGGGYDAFLSDLSLVRPFGTAPPKPAPSTRAARRTSALSISGTPPYMAPEQYDEDGRDIGPWTDLYAVGVMLYELITGQLPFAGDVLSLVFAKGTQRPPRLAPRPGYLIPKGLGEIAAALLSKYPGSRGELAADVQAALRALGPAEVRGHGEADTARSVVLPPTLLGLEENAEAIEEVQREVQRSGDALQPTPTPAPAVVSLPHEPSQDPGRGAYTRSSLSLYSYRRPALMGREAEMRELWRVAGSVLAGQTQIVLFEGEAGVGKSRLCRWLTESLECLGAMRVVRVRGNDRTGLVGALSSLLGGYGLEKQELRGRLEAALAGLGEPDTSEAAALTRWLSPIQPEDIPPLHEQDALFVRAVQRAARRGAVCVWFDDSSPSALSPGLLDLLLAGPRPVLCLITPPPREAQSPEGDYSQLAARPGVVRLSVPALRPDDCRDLVRELFSLSDDLVSFAASRAEGNPLYAVQLVGHWVDAKLLEPDPARPGVFRRRDGISERQLLPPSTAEIFRSRVRALVESASDPEAFAEALHAAALMGQNVSWRLFQEYLDTRFGQERAKAIAWAVLGAGVLRPLQGGRSARFEHAMLCDILAAEARERDDAPALRRALGQLVERRAADLEGLIDAAEHWEAAGEGPRAAQIYLRAAQLGIRVDVARAAWALRRARALAGGSGAPPELASRIEAELAHAARIQGDIAASTRHADAALALSKDKATAAAAHLALGYLARQQLEIAQAKEHFTRAHEAATQAREPRSLTRATLGLGDVALTSGQLPEALALYTRAKELSPQANDPFALGRALNRLGDALRATGDIAAAARHYGEARTLSSQRGDRITELIALSGLGDVALLTGDADGAIENFCQAHQLARRANYPEGRLIGALNLAAAHLERREPDLAATFLDEASDLLPRGGHWAKPLLHLVSAWCEAMQERFDAAEKHLREAHAAGLPRYYDQDAARAAEGCGDESQGPRPALSQAAYAIARAQYQALGRSADLARLDAKK